MKIEVPETDLYMPVITAECSENPVFQDCLQVQNKTLYLAPITAGLFDGKLKKGKESRAVNRYLNYEHLGKLQLDIGGVLKGWSKNRFSGLVLHDDFTSHFLAKTYRFECTECRFVGRVMGETPSVSDP